MPGGVSTIRSGFHPRRGCLGMQATTIMFVTPNRPGLLAERVVPLVPTRSGRRWSRRWALPLVRARDRKVAAHCSGSISKPLQGAGQSLKGGRPTQDICPNFHLSDVLTATSGAFHPTALASEPTDLASSAISNYTVTDLTAPGNIRQMPVASSANGRPGMDLAFAQWHTGDQCKAHTRQRTPRQVNGPLNSDMAEAERRAIAAEGLPAFSRFKLLHLKTQINEILTQFGRSGLFEEYTKHDLTHLRAMLNIYDWLIPEETKDAISPAGHF